MNRRADGQTGRRADETDESRQSSVVSRQSNDDSVLSPQSSVLSTQHSALWIPDNPDGSGWADVDWVSAVRGSRYHYRHAEPHEEALALLPPCYRVVTRLDTPALHAPHENSYYVPREHLADLLAELSLSGGAETIWHVEPCDQPPAESRIQERASAPRVS